MNITRVHQIEISSRCNLACKYCPHPLFVPMLRQARNKLPNAWLLLATNGIAIVKGEEETVASILHALRVVGASVYVSTHRPEIAGPAVEILIRAGIKVGVNTAFVTSGFDWAGQVEWHGGAAPATECQYIAQGWATVLQDGTIVNCCMDAHGLHPIGNVRDAVKPTRIDPIPLCEKCHLRIPI